MIHYKTPAQLKIMQKAGEKLKKILPEIIDSIRIGVSTAEINSLAEEKIKKAGGYPAFKRVKGYRWATCIAVNEQLVHTPPSDRVLQSSDVVTLDIGLEYKGFCVDYAHTIALPPVSDKISKFLQKGRQTLEQGIKIIQETKNLYQYAEFVHKSIESAGYSIVRELTGHGIGKRLHEDPFVFNFPDKSLRYINVKSGLCIAVEIIYAMGKGRMVYEDDGWSVKTADNTISACFEHTVAIVGDRLKVLV